MLTCLQAACNKQAFILPAFETYGVYKEAAALADTIASRDKARLMFAALTARIPATYQHMIGVLLMMGGLGEA
jgi:hypothetical protein